MLIWRMNSRTVRVHHHTFPKQHQHETNVNGIRPQGKMLYYTHFSLDGVSGETGVTPLLLRYVTPHLRVFSLFAPWSGPVGLMAGIVTNACVRDLYFRAMRAETSHSPVLAEVGIDELMLSSVCCSLLLPQRAEWVSQACNFWFCVSYALFISGFGSFWAVHYLRRNDCPTYFSLRPDPRCYLTIIWKHGILLDSRNFLLDFFQNSKTWEFQILSISFSFFPPNSWSKYLYISLYIYIWWPFHVFLFNGLWCYLRLTVFHDFYRSRFLWPKRVYYFYYSH